VTYQFVPSLNIIFQSTPSFLTPVPTSASPSTTSASSLLESGIACPAPTDGPACAPFEFGEGVGPKALSEGERLGDGGGNARDGRRAIGLRDLGVAGLGEPRLGVVL
jgi:hypothetical protein